jgi:O-antigen/teichoic acid export membrane protein
MNARQDDISPPGRKLFGPRGRSVLHTSAWSLIGKCASAANLFVSVPYVLHTIGPEQFGAWATLVSFVFFAGFLDFGFGNGTMNLIAAARGRGAHDEIVTIWIEGTRVLSRVALILAGLALIAVPLVPWHHVLGMPASEAAACRTAAAVVLASIVIAIPLNLAARVQLGLGRGDRAFRWQTLGQLLAIFAVIACAHAHATLATLTAAAVATPLLGALGNTLQLRHTQRATSVAIFKTSHKGVATRIRHEGLQFFVLQLAGALAFSSDLPLISAIRGPVDAGAYAIIQKLFSIIPIGLSLLWVPLWPIYRQALAAGDHAWVFRTLRRSLILAIVLAGGGAAVLALGFKQVTTLWLHKPLMVSNVVLAGFVVWSLLEACGAALAAFLNAASIMRYQVIIGIVFGASCVIAKFAILQAFSFDLLPWTTSVIYLLAVLLPLSALFPRIIKSTLTKVF